MIFVLAYNWFDMRNLFPKATMYTVEPSSFGAYKHSVRKQRVYDVRVLGQFDLR